MASCTMPAKIIYPFTQNLEATSFFSQELQFSRESQVGLFNPEPMPDHSSGGQEVKVISKNHSILKEPKSGTGIASDICKIDNHYSKFWPYLLNQSAFAFMQMEPQRGSLYDNDLLSRSLSSDKFSKNSSNVPFHQPADKNNLKLEEEEPFESIEGIEDRTIGNLLRDDDGIPSGQPNSESLSPRPARWCSMELLYPETEQEDTNGWKQGSGSLGNDIENRAVHSLHSLISAAMNPLMDNTSRSISYTVPQSSSFATKSNDFNYSLGQTNFGFEGTPGFFPESVPDFNHEQKMDMNINSKSVRGIEKRCPCELGFSSLNNHYFENNGAFGVCGDGSCIFHGSYIWNDSEKFQRQPWSSSYSFTSNAPGHLPSQRRVISSATSQMMDAVLPSGHAASSPTINPSLWNLQNGYAGEFTHQGSFQSGSLEGMGFSGSPQLGFSSHVIFPRATGNCMNSCICSLPLAKCQAQLFHARNHMIPNDRIKGRKSDAKSNQADNKQHELDIEQIKRGEDARTTLMIKNIPNKYTSKMLLAAIDEKHRGTYDFIYLPIDFKNKCNVGYAFINMAKAEYILPFYESFNGKKWEKFNSEKVTSLAYARIQGKAALIAHFQNSSLMNEDKRFRPILFHSEGPNAGEPEPFPVGGKIRSRSRRSRTTIGVEDIRQVTLSAAYSKVESCCNAQSNSAYNATSPVSG